MDLANLWSVYQTTELKSQIISGNFVEDRLISNSETVFIRLSRFSSIFNTSIFLENVSIIVDTCFFDNC